MGNDSTVAGGPNNGCAQILLVWTVTTYEQVSRSSMLNRKSPWPSWHTNCTQQHTLGTTSRKKQLDLFIHNFNNLHIFGMLCNFLHKLMLHFTRTWKIHKNKYSWRHYGITENVAYGRRWTSNSAFVARKTLHCMTAAARSLHLKLNQLEKLEYITFWQKLTSLVL